MHVLGLKKEPIARDAAVFPVTSVSNASVGNRFDSSRAASTSHPDLMQLRQPAVLPQRQGESAVSRLTPRMAGTNAQLGGDSAELRLGSDNVNNQRVMEWQMRNQMAKDAASVGQVPRRFQSESDSTLAISSEQRPNYYPSRPQSQFIEPGYVMSGPTKTASPQPQSTSMSAFTDTVAARGQTVAGFGQQSSVSTPVSSDDQRYRLQQLQPNTYGQQLATSTQPQFKQTANVRPAQMSEIVRHPLPGMVPQDVRYPGPYVHSDSPDVRQQPTVIGENTQYRLSAAVSSPTLAVSCEQPANYYPSRPQSQLIQPGYVMSKPAKTASPQPQSTSMPENVVGNRSQTVAGFGQQSSASVSTPVYSDDQRYRPQQSNVYGQQILVPAQPRFNQTSNMRPQMSQLVRHALPGMAATDTQHPGQDVRSNLQGIRQQPPAVGSDVQYQSSGGQYVVQGTPSSTVTAPSAVQYGIANVSGATPATFIADGRLMYTPGVRYDQSDAYNRKSAPPPAMQYEMSTVENRAVPVGVLFSTDSRPYAANEGLYNPPHVDGPAPADVRYGMPNVAGAAPSVRPVVPNVDDERKFQQADVRYGMPAAAGEMLPAPPGARYNLPSAQDRLAVAVPHQASEDQSAVKFSQQGGYYDSVNTAVSYSSQAAPYRVHSVPVAPGNMQREPGSPSNAGDSWPLPPTTEHYGSPSVRSEFSIPPAVNVPPPSSQFSAPQLQNVSDGSKPVPSEVHPRMQSVINPVPSMPRGMPSNDVRPKKQAPPVAAKPKLPVTTGMAVRTKDTGNDESKQLKPEKIQQKLLEIQRLESRPYLTAGEQTKLQNLRVEVEFDKRLAEMNEKRESTSDLEPHMMLPPTVRWLLSLSSALLTYFL